MLFSWRERVSIALSFTSGQAAEMVKLFVSSALIVSPIFLQGFSSGLIISMITSLSVMLLMVMVWVLGAVRWIGVERRGVSSSAMPMASDSNFFMSFPFSCYF